MSELMTLRMVDGSTVLAEVNVSENMSDGFDLKNPLEIRRTVINGEDAATAIPYLNGTDEEIVSISGYHIITASPVSLFFRKFYGSALFRVFIQKAYQKMMLAGSQNIDAVTKMMLQS